MNRGKVESKYLLNRFLYEQGRPVAREEIFHWFSGQIAPGVALRLGKKKVQAQSRKNAKKGYMVLDVSDYSHERLMNRGIKYVAQSNIDSRVKSGTIEKLPDGKYTLSDAGREKTRKIIEKDLLLSTGSDTTVSTPQER